MENNEQDTNSKTPKRTRRTSVKESLQSTLELHENERVPVLKTPKRTRRTSVADPLLQLAEIEESDSISLTRKDAITPGRSTRTLDFRTPSRSESLAGAQTPRRSCRKSIKPIQEYETIVAQKGLSVKAKRLITEQTTSEEADDASSTTAEIRESKWTPADIGRVSTKRSKKKKNKRMQRQNAIVDENKGEEKHQILQQSADLNEDLCHKDELEKVNICVEQEIKITDDHLDHNHKLEEEDEEKNEEVVVVEKANIIDHPNDELEEKSKDVSVEKAVTIEDHNDEFEENNEKDASVEMTTNTDECAVEEDIEVKNLSTEVMPTPDIRIDEHCDVESDDSMDEGDVILNSMPITGDDCMQDERVDVIRNAMPVTGDYDCMQSPEKPLQQGRKSSLSIVSVAESANKSNDSDCIMLSLNDSPQSGQSTLQIPSPVVCEASKYDANDSSDCQAMPPLIVCSDDDEENDEDFVDAASSPDGAIMKSALNEVHCKNNQLETLDGTFNTNDENKEDKCIDTEMGNEEEKRIDIVMCPEDIRKIVHGFDEKPKDVTLPSTPANEQMSPLNETFDADESPPTKTIMEGPFTPKAFIARSSVTRHPTPFKTDTKILPDIIIEPEEEELEEPFNVIIESRENKLKGSRKRSFSFCVDRPKKNVTFHSPSNSTVNIYSGDLIKSAIKKTPINVTKRRKRSISVTETDRDLMDCIHQKKPTQSTTTPKKKTVHQSKIKMPNFFDILTDHVARRAERAYNLINSNSKVKPVSVQKGLPVKNSVLRDQNKDGNKTHIPKPKARQRIDMSGPENKSKIDSTYSSFNTGLKSRSKSKQDIRQLDDVPLIGKTPTKVSANSTCLFKQNNTNKIPKPRFNFNFNSTTLSTCGNTTVTSVPPQKIHLPNPRENFNLSTNINAATVSRLPKIEKLEDRRKRMMDMFKSKSTHRVVENKKEILKGVRTNRRFELQMMCRNRQN